MNRKRMSESEEVREKKGPRFIGAWKSGSNIGAVSYQAWPDHFNWVICLMKSNDQALL